VATEPIPPTSKEMSELPMLYPEEPATIPFTFLRAEASDEVAVTNKIFSGIKGLFLADLASDKYIVLRFIKIKIIV
jgi:hypothetical protein